MQRVGLLHLNYIVMLAYSDIHLEDLKNLSVQSFTQLLINDLYPFVYSEINKLEQRISQLKPDYDVELLATIEKKIYADFDALYRKEKLVLFPYVLKLDEENTKSENCTPFKNTKLHYTSMVNHITSARELVSHFFVNDANNETIIDLNHTLSHLAETMIEIQFIKEKYFFKNYKNCGGCKPIIE